MSSTISAAGSDFISGILNELQDLGRRIEEEAKSRRAVEKRADEFEASMKKLSEALGGEIRQVQQHAEALDAKAAQRAEVQAARITKIETQLPLLSMAVDLERLGSRVQAMSEEATRDRTATKAALEANAAKVDADFVEVRARLDELHVEALQLQAEVNKKAWGADVISLGSKVDNLQAEMQTRALATDVQAVEYRTTTAEKSLQMLKEEVAKKALPSDIKAVADTVGDLAAQVAANRTKAMADAEVVGARVGELKLRVEPLERGLLEVRNSLEVESALPATIQAIASSVKALERRTQNDGERQSACLVAIEREVGRKAGLTDVEQLVGRLCSLEQVVPPLVPSLAQKASVEELQRMQARTEALEKGFAAKAEAAAFDKACLDLANQQARQEELRGTSTEHNLKINALATQGQDHEAKLDEAAKAIEEIRAVVQPKVSIADVYTKETMDSRFLDYYLKTEIDALFSRVWWRLEQSGKVVGIKALATTR